MTVAADALKRLHLLISILIIGVTITHGFNLETRLPVIKQGKNGSYFGYAVAAHQILKGSDGLILVGAPLDQNLQPNTTRSGALWRCPLTNYRNDCKQVITDGRLDPQNSSYNTSRDLDIEQLFPPRHDEMKEDQWLGVTVKSQGPGGKVMVCAHRYKVNNSDYIPGWGLCYILKNDLEFEDAHNMCKGRYRGEGHKDFGVCQSGTSGLIYDEDAIIGAPGTMTWRGAIFVFSVAEDYLLREKMVYMGNGTASSDDYDELENSNELIKKYGYMGMSLAAGHFIGNNNSVEYAAGAPRASQTGQVVFFKKLSSLNGQPVVSHLQEFLIIRGEQIASNFGYEIIGADVNGDKLTDIIVAAPFYFNSRTNEGGAVYIYLNDPVNHIVDRYSAKITGKMESRFGFAMTCLGDLNKDGFDDIAVGAPYEGNGVVYIYLGSKDGLITKPSQVIKAENIAVNLPIRTFGYSLSGGIDLDENGYPDLVIGAYEKDLVVLLRARPIIQFTTYIKSASSLINFDPQSSRCVVDGNSPCFQFETCCVVKSTIKSYGSRQLLVKYTLEAETFNNQSKSSRIEFDNFHSKVHQIVKNITITNINIEYCQKHTAYLKENVQDIQTPIQMRMSYHLIHREPRQSNDTHLSSLENYPILDQQEADKVFNATFLKNCGTDDICESMLVVDANFSLRNFQEFFNNVPGMYELVLGEQQKVVLNVSVINLGESAYEAKLYIELPKPVEFAHVITSNEKTPYVCSPQNTLIVCDLGNPLKKDKVVKLQLELDLRKVGELEPDLNFKIFANTTSIDKNANDEPLNLKVKVIEKTNLTIFGISDPEEIPRFVNVQLKAESAVTFKDEIGVKVTHNYTVWNQGLWSASGIRVDFEWPFQVANNKPQGKWLLYMDEMPFIEQAHGVCEISNDFVNPRKLLDRRPEDVHSSYVPSDKNLPGDKSLLPEKTVSSKSQHNRMKRDTENIVTSETYTNKDGIKTTIVKMNCLLHTAKCFKFSCILNPIESKQLVTISIRSRLWDATLIEDYSNVGEIIIASRANLHIRQSKVALPNPFSTETQVETRARVKIPGQLSAAPVPLWIIIAAIFFGLILFVLLTLCLWKLGFFKRRRPDPTLSGNLEKHKIDEYHDY